MTLVFAFMVLWLPTDAVSQPVSADSLITVSIEDEPLRSVLDEISRLSLLRFVFDDALIDPVRTSVRCEDCTAMRVLGLALENTQLEAVLQSAQLVVIRPQTESDDGSVTTRIIQGRVVDRSSGTPLAFAHVIHATGGTVTDGNGAFELPISGVDDEIRFKYLGFDDQTIQWDGESALEVRMTPSLAELGAVVVNGGVLSSADDPFAQASVLTGRQLESIPSVAGADPLIGLSQLPGVDDVEERAGALYIRGATPDEVLIEWAGIPLFNTDHFFGLISALNPDAVDQATMFRYGSPARLGGRTGGFVQLDPASSLGGFRASASVSPLHASLATRIPISRNAGLLVAGRLSLPSMERQSAYRTYFDSVLGSNGDQPGFTFGDVNVRFSALRGSRHLFAVNALLSSDQLAQTYEEEFSILDLAGNTVVPDEGTGASGQKNGLLGLGRLDDDDDDDDDDEEEEFEVEESEPIRNGWSSRGFSAEWQTEWNERVSSHLLATVSRYTSQFDYRRSLESDRVFEAHRFALSTVEERRLQWSHDLRLGANRFSGGSFLKRVALKESDGVTENLDDVEQVFERDNWGETATVLGGFVEWTMNRDRFKSATGLRLVRFGPAGQFDLEPRFRAAVSLTDALSLSGSWERHHQYLFRVLGADVLEEPRDRWEIPDNDPARSTLRSVGLRWDVGHTSFHAEAFSNTFDGVSQLSRRRNAEDLQSQGPGSGDSKGVELHVRYTRGPLVAWSTYTRTRVEYTFDWLNEGQSFAALHDRPHSSKTGLEWRVGSWRVGSSVLWASGRPSVIPDGSLRAFDPIGNEIDGAFARSVIDSRLPFYQRVDVHARRHVQFGSTEGEIEMAVINVFDRSNVRYRRLNRTEDQLLFQDILMLGFTPTITLRVGRGLF